MQSIHQRILFVPVASAIISILITAGNSLSKAAAQSLQLTPAQLQRLKERRHRILEAGVIESADVLQFHCELPNEGTILFIVPDGADVKQGDVLAELDDSELQESLSAQRIAGKQTEVALTAAEADLEAAETLAARALPVAELTLKTAELELQRRVGKGGELSFELRTIEQNIKVARQELERLAEHGNGDSQRREVQSQLDAALAKKKLFEHYIRPHETAALKLAVARAGLALQQQQTEAARAVREVKATLAAAKVAHEYEQEKLNTLAQQVRDCRIVAPRDGVVVHAVAASRRRTSNAFEAGATVNSRELLIEMPDLKKLRARVLVNESQIARVKPGQPVTLQLDALPQREFHGEVTTVNRTPGPAGSWLTSEVVEYAVLVRISDPAPAFKIGMRVAAEINAPVND